MSALVLPNVCTVWMNAMLVHLNAEPDLSLHFWTLRTAAHWWPFTNGITIEITFHHTSVNLSQYDLKVDVCHYWRSGYGHHVYYLCDDQGQVLYSVGHSCQYMQLFLWFSTDGTQRTQYVTWKFVTSTINELHTQQLNHITKLSGRFMVLKLHPWWYGQGNDIVLQKAEWQNLIKQKKYCKIYKITKITLGSTRNQNGYNKNCQKINWMGTMSITTSRKTGLRWLDQVEEDLKKMKVRNWTEKCKDRRLSNKTVKQAKTHQGL